MSRPARHRGCCVLGRRAESAGQRVHPKAVGGATGRTLLVVDDPDVAFGQAVTAGATPLGDGLGLETGVFVPLLLLACPYAPSGPDRGNPAACYRRSGTIPIVYPHARSSRRAVATLGSRAPVS